MDILRLRSEIPSYIRHTQRYTHIYVHVHVYFLSLTILICWRTKSKVNRHPQLPAVARATLWNRGRVIYAGAEIVYTL